MSRTLEEILNTPVEFKEGMRVFELIGKKWGIIYIYRGDDADYPVIVKYDSGCDEAFTRKGQCLSDYDTRTLFTEQEAYELFPSLKPKVYEYQVVYKYNSKFYFSEHFCISNEEFREKYKNDGCVFVELYQPSKRERRS